MLITDVGRFTGTTLEGVANTLVCDTRNVNTLCCRGSDGQNVGEWFFPGDGGGVGTMVPRNRVGGAITRIGFTQQVRLSRNTDTLTPTGEYTCMVPTETGTVTESETITVIAGKYIHANKLVMTECLSS